MNNQNQQDQKNIAILGAGCFWGVEETLRKLDGVKDTTVGFMGGDVENPSYNQVCSGRTGHTEVVKVEFDPAEITFEQLLKNFWEMHSPVPNPKDNSPKTQYKSVIFYQNQQQKNIAEKVKKQTEKVIEEKLATEILPAKDFYKAEDKHQKYYKKLKES
jgi:peptide-methionine (S)-S-oxide reductase